MKPQLSSKLEVAVIYRDFDAGMHWPYNADFKIRQ